MTISLEIIRLILPISNQVFGLALSAYKVLVRDGILLSSALDDSIRNYK